MRTSKRVASFGVILLSCLGLATVARGQTASLKLSSASGTKGSNITLPLSYTSGGAQGAGVQWTLAYSPTDFSNIAVSTGSAASGAGKTVSCNSSALGQYTCIAIGQNATAISDGVVATATLTVASSTTATSSTVQVSNVSASSPAGDNVSAAGSAGTVSITQSVPALSGLSCSPNSITSPGSSQCTVTLAGPAPSSGVIVALGWTGTGASVSMPSNVTVAAGGTTAQFIAQISGASSASSVQISASANSVTKTFTVSVTPPASVSVTVSPSNPSIVAGQTQQFTASVSGASTQTVTWSVSPSVGTVSSAGLYTAPASVSTPQTITVRATSSADATKYGTASVVVNPPTPNGGGTTMSFWSGSAVPKVASDLDTASVELGLKFTTDVAGYITGIRFYKGSNNTGQHIGHLWTSTGKLLTTVTFSNETASGWQQANLSTPVAISAGSYVVSYTAPHGGYSDNVNFFTSNSIDILPLHIPGGPSGVYSYGSTPSFPNQTWQSSNYWVDVVFRQ